MITLSITDFTQDKELLRSCVFIYLFYLIFKSHILFFPQVVVDQCLVDFGTHVVGQNVSRVITLTNRGALGTRYMLTPITNVPLQQSFTTLVNNTDTSIEYLL